MGRSPRHSLVVGRAAPLWLAATALLTLLVTPAPEAHAGIEASGGPPSTPQTSACDPQPAPRTLDLSGLWKTDQGALVRVTQASGKVVMRFLNPGTCAATLDCPLGAGAESYLKGTLAGEQLTVTMTRCTHDPDMREAGFEPYWSAACTVTAATDRLITGMHRSQYYEYDVKNGKKVNFRRHEKGDADYPFQLTRADCQTEFTALVAKIDEKSASLQQARQDLAVLEGPVNRVLSRWLTEAGRRLRRESFTQALPPSIQAIPAAEKPDLPLYAATWTSFAAELTAKQGDFAAENASRLPRMAELVTAWERVIAGAAPMLEELDPLDEEFAPRRDGVIQLTRSLANAGAEYQALKEYCSAEAASAPQPRAPLPPLPAAVPGKPLPPSMEQSTTLTVATHLTEADTALKEAALLLRPYRDAGSGKTCFETLGRTQLNKLTTALSRAASATSRGLKVLQDGPTAAPVPSLSGGTEKPAPAPSGDR